MFYRIAVIQAHDTITADKTEIYDINIKDPISQLIFLWRGKNNGNAPSGHPIKSLKKVEVIDGSDVIVSLSGIQIQALDYYEQQVSNFQVLNYLDDQYVEPLARISFGRFIYDQLYALDPKRFTNPQLKVTIELNAGGSSCDEGTIEIIAHAFDQKIINPVGFMMSKEIHSFVLAGAGYEYIDLPVDYPYRKILVGALVDGKEPHEEFEELKLSEENDKRVIFDDKTQDLIKYMVTHINPIQETLKGLTDNTGVKFYITPSYNANIIANPYVTAAPTQYLGSNALKGGTVTLYAATGSQQFKALISGYCPHGFIGYNFGKQEDNTDWFDVRKVGDLELRIKGGAGSTGLCTTLLQQARSY